MAEIKNMTEPNDRSDKFIDSGEGMDLAEASCWTCVRKHENSPTCDAFLERIPNAILDGEHDHTTPFPGDRGLLFLPRALRSGFSQTTGGPGSQGD